MKCKFLKNSLSSLLLSKRIFSLKMSQKCNGHLNQLEVEGFNVWLCKEIQ